VTLNFTSAAVTPDIVFHHSSEYIFSTEN